MDQLATISRMLNRRRWFFAKVTGRRHVQRFLDAKPKYATWTVEYAAIAPKLTADQRKVLARHDVIAQDLGDLTANLQ